MGHENRGPQVLRVVSVTSAAETGASRRRVRLMCGEVQTRRPGSPVPKARTALEDLCVHPVAHTPLTLPHIHPRVFIHIHQPLK